MFEITLPLTHGGGMGGGGGGGWDAVTVVSLLPPDFIISKPRLVQG